MSQSIDTLRDGPRPPSQTEWPELISFLSNNLRQGIDWSIADEYPTALAPSNLHNMRIITEGSQILSHAVLKPLIVKTPLAIFKVGAIGSVVTNESYRNQGLSQKILHSCLNLAVEQKCDITILWSDLHDFYRKMNFELAGSELHIQLREISRDLPNKWNFSNSTQISAESLLRVYNLHSIQTLRTVEDFKRYLKIPNSQVYTAWDPQGSLSAYAIMGKGADLKGYIHEWGGSVPALLGLFSWLQHEKSQAVTLICPRHSENLLKKLDSSIEYVHQGYLGLIKITDPDQLFAKIKRAFRAEGVSDIVLERQNGYVLFGCDKNLVTINDERSLVQLLFGPTQPHEVDLFTVLTKEKLSKILPLPFWLWGWDSI